MNYNIHTYINKYRVLRYNPLSQDLSKAQKKFSPLCQGDRTGMTRFLCNKKDVQVLSAFYCHFSYFYHFAGTESS